MKNPILILILIALVFSCKSKQQSTKIDNSIFNRADNDSLFITISRSPCFGRCPSFEAKIYESGYVAYKGKRDVANVGDYFFYITTEQLKGLKQTAIDIKYFEMKDRYDNEHVTDLPECVTSVQLDGRRKTIKNRIEGPAGLSQFEKMIDALFKDVEMKKAVQTDDKKD